MNYRILLMLGLASFFALMGCDEDDELDIDDAGSTPTVAQFFKAETIVKESDGERTILISFPAASRREGTVKIMFDQALAEYFTTVPAQESGIISLPVKKNDRNVFFKLIPIDNSVANDPRAISFTLKEVSEGFQIGSQKNHNVIIEDNESEAPAEESTVNFIPANATIKENYTDAYAIQLEVTEGATANGSVIIEAVSAKGVYGVHFITEPALTDNVLALAAVPGNSVLSFKVTTINNDHISGNVDVTFKIKETTGNLKKGTTIDESLHITDDELEGMPKGYESGGGSWGSKKTYEYNSNGSIATILQESYTPGYSSQTDTYFYNEQNQLIRINTHPGQDLVYHYEGDRIVKEEKIDNGEMDRYTEYSYDQFGNVDGWRIFHLQPDKSFALSFVAILLYHTDGNLYKHIVYTPSPNTEDELVLVSTSTYDNYIDKENPFPMVQVVPGKKTQHKLPTTYRLETNGHDLLYNMSYEYREDGKVSKRVATQGNILETTVYHYY